VRVLKKSLAFFPSVGLSNCSRYLVGFFVLKLNDEFPLSTESILDHVKCIPETVMSEHGKNLFIEQHNDGYAILRGSVEKPLAVEPTQDAAIEKARKLEPDAAIHVERVRNVEGSGSHLWTVGTDGIILYSADGGEHWKSQMSVTSRHLGKSVAGSRD